MFSIGQGLQPTLHQNTEIRSEVRELPLKWILLEAPYSSWK